MLREIDATHPKLAGSFASDAETVPPEIASETRRAVLSAADPRWVFAAQVEARMQGAVLPAQSRDRLLGLGSRLGLTPFDANVIIAIVQDCSRRREPLSATMPMLRLVAHPASRTQVAARTWTRWLAAVLCAAMATTFLVWWIIS